MTKIVYLSISFLFLFQSTVKSQFKTIEINSDVQLLQITESLYAHVTYINSEKWGRFSCNGAVYINNGKALLIDTPMDTLQTVQLVSYLKDSLNAVVSHFIPGHYHGDCVNGMPYLHSVGVKSFANNLTIQKCNELNIEAPQNGFADSLTINFEGANVVCYYMGGGHTVDNIVVHFPDENVLFGGCFVKSNSSTNLGNLNDAAVEQWPQAMQKTKNRFGNVKHVIPGHGSISGPEQFDHTMELLSKHNDKK